MDLIQLKTRPVVIRRELFDHYSELGLDEQDLVILIKLLYASETSNKQPSIEFLQKGSTMEPRQITSVIQNLIQRELLELNVSKDEEGKFTEYMNLDPFYHKLNQLLKHQYLKHEEQDKKEQFKQLFQIVDRILLNWKKNNVKTVDDSKKIREQFNKPKMKHVVKKVPKFDWLNGENPNDK